MYDREQETEYYEQNEYTKYLVFESPSTFDKIKEFIQKKVKEKKAAAKKAAAKDKSASRKRVRK